MGALLTAFDLPLRDQPATFFLVLKSYCKTNQKF